MKIKAFFPWIQISLASKAFRVGLHHLAQWDPSSWHRSQGFLPWNSSPQSAWPEEAAMAGLRLRGGEINQTKGGRLLITVRSIKGSLGFHGKFRRSDPRSSFQWEFQLQGNVHNFKVLTLQESQVSLDVNNQDQTPLQHLENPGPCIKTFYSS